MLYLVLCFVPECSIPVIFLELGSARGSKQISNCRLWDLLCVSAVWVQKGLTAEYRFLNHCWDLNFYSERLGHLTVVKGIFILKTVLQAQQKAPPSAHEGRHSPGWGILIWGISHTKIIQHRGICSVDWSSKWVLNWQRADRKQLVQIPRIKGI